jgi:hypothetical protein
MTNGVSVAVDRSMKASGFLALRGTNVLFKLGLMTQNSNPSQLKFVQGALNILLPRKFGGKVAEPVIVIDWRRRDVRFP